MNWWLILLLLFASLPAGAVCHVISPTGSNANSGADWNNAFAWPPPATLVRGDTYYIATGNYTGGYSFNTAESGTTLIVIKKAAASDHCTDTGYSASFGTGQAVFDISNGTTFSFTNNGYWTFDGQYRTDRKTGHGFKINWGTKCIGTSAACYAVNVNGCASGPPCTPQLRNLTFRYLEIAGGGVNSTTDDVYTVSSVSRNAAGTQATVVINPNAFGNAHYIADNPPSVVGSLIAVSGVSDPSFNTASARVIATSDALTFTYANSGTGSASSNGGSVTGGLGGLFEFDFRFAGTIDGLTLEYSYIHDTSDTPVQNDGRPSNTTIQYCVIARNTNSTNHHSEGYAIQGSNYSGSIDPNGRDNIRYNIFEDITGTGNIAAVGNSGSPVNRMDIYGNVFMWHQGNPYRRNGVGNGVIATTSVTAANDWKVYNNTFVNTGDSLTSDASGAIFSTANLGSGSGFTAQNNLCYFPSGKACSYGGSGTTHDWTFCSTTGACPSETHIQTSTGTPLVDWINQNYHLAAATNAGTTLASPYNTDPDGVTRGSDGTWDRGAFEFGGSSCSPVVSSVTLNPTSVAGGNTSAGTVTVSCAPSSDTVVNLSSSNTAVATVPASCTVTATSTKCTFTVTTVGVCVSTNVTITATLNGSTTAALTVTAGGALCQGANVIGTATIVGGVKVQ